MKEKVIKIMLGWVENNEPIETTADKLLDLFAVINWAAFDFQKLETRPPKAEVNKPKKNFPKGGV